MFAPYGDARELAPASATATRTSPPCGPTPWPLSLSASSASAAAHTRSQRCGRHGRSGILVRAHSDVSRCSLAETAATIFRLVNGLFLSVHVSACPPSPRSSSPPGHINKPVQFPQKRHRLNTRWAVDLHGRPGLRPPLQCEQATCWLVPTQLMITGSLFHGTVGGDLRCLGGRKIILEVGQSYARTRRSVH